MKTSSFGALQNELKKSPVSMKVMEDVVLFKLGDKELSYRISSEAFDFDAHVKDAILPLDYLVKEPAKTAAAILSKLGGNKRVYARQCQLKKVDKQTAADFLDDYHLMNATQSAFNYGLYFENDLIALASFSKGRKMDRLPEDKRSFELIRFCCKPGITVTGGLTKLLRYFCDEKKAGDIMTYVDKQWSDGSAFIKAGFKKHGETGANCFRIDKKSFERIAISCDENIDTRQFYLSKNKGNIKLVYTPGTI